MLMLLFYLCHPVPGVRVVVGEPLLLDHADEVEAERLVVVVVVVVPVVLADALVQLVVLAQVLDGRPPRHGVLDRALAVLAVVPLALRVVVVGGADLVVLVVEVPGRRVNNIEFLDSRTPFSQKTRSNFFPNSNYVERKRNKKPVSVFPPSRLPLRL